MQTRQAFRAEEKCATVQKATVSLIFSRISSYCSHETYENRRKVSNWVSLELTKTGFSEEDSLLLFPPWLSSGDQATFL